MKVLITGNGQLANDLLDTCPESVALVHCPRSELDVTSPENCQQIVSKHNPDWIINAAAYTAVDKAESDQESAYSVNKQGVANLANCAKNARARLIHVSTDFVFNGNNCVPYKETDPTDPIGVYGASKLEGEKELLRILDDGIVVRTSWVYSKHGNNFVKTMLNLMKTKEKLGVIVEQIGSPTWSAGFANTLWQMVQKNSSAGIYHWSDGGVCSWYDFSVAIQRQALELGLLDKAIPIQPIPTSAYPTPAARPNYSVMDKTKIEQELGISTVHWQTQLREMLLQLSD